MRASKTGADLSTPIRRFCQPSCRQPGRVFGTRAPRASPVGPRICHPRARIVAGQAADEALARRERRRAPIASERASRATNAGASPTAPLQVAPTRRRQRDAPPGPERACQKESRGANAPAPGRPATAGDAAGGARQVGSRKCRAQRSSRQNAPLSVPRRRRSHAAQPGAKKNPKP